MVDSTWPGMSLDVADPLTGWLANFVWLSLGRHTDESGELGMSESLPVGPREGDAAELRWESADGGVRRTGPADVPIRPRSDRIGALSEAPRKGWVFWPLAMCLVLVDCTTKELAETHLVPAEVPHEVVGSIVRFTLGYNPGAAFGIDFPGARPVLTLAAMLIVGVLFQLYRRAGHADASLSLALALVTGGAIGNLLDRVFSPNGVVDFIDVGVGPYRFWTFNLADVAITAGAVLLVGILWRRDQELHAVETSSA